MKIRLGLLVLLIAVAIVVVAILRYPISQPPAPPAPPASPRPQPSSPTQVVRAYLTALEKKDFRAAYSHLSKESQQAHPYQEFASAAEKSGVPSYDLAGGEEKPGEEGRVTVTLPLTDDPAEAGFTMVKEGEAWKVVFIGGAPAFPYP